MYFVPLDVLCTFTFESSKSIEQYISMYESITSTGDKKGTKYMGKYIYVLSGVLCTFDCNLNFKCTLKGTR
jgi:hypothetical protein